MLCPPTCPSEAFLRSLPAPEKPQGPRGDGWPERCPGGRPGLQWKTICPLQGRPLPPLAEGSNATQPRSTHPEREWDTSFLTSQVPVKLGEMPASPPLTQPASLWAKVGVGLASQPRTLNPLDTLLPAANQVPR